MLERNDYVKANKKLCKKVAEAAALLLKKMKELDITELDCQRVCVYREEISANGGQFHDDILFINYETRGDLLQSVCDLDSGFYWTGDFHCWVQYATPQEFLDFANNWQDIVATVKAVEKERADTFTTAADAMEDTLEI